MQTLIRLQEQFLKGPLISMVPFPSYLIMSHRWGGARASHNHECWVINAGRAYDPWIKRHKRPAWQKVAAKWADFREDVWLLGAAWPVCHYLTTWNETEVHIWHLTAVKAAGQCRKCWKLFYAQPTDKSTKWLHRTEQTERIWFIPFVWIKMDGTCPSHPLFEQRCSSLFGVMLVMEICCLFYLQFLLTSAALWLPRRQHEKPRLWFGLVSRKHMEQSVWAGRLNVLVQTAGEKKRLKVLRKRWKKHLKWFTPPCSVAGLVPHTLPGSQTICLVLACLLAPI